MVLRNTPAESLETLKRVLRDVNYELKKMFGKYTFFINGNMFCGVHNSDFFMRFDRETRQDVMGTVSGVLPWEP